MSLTNQDLQAISQLLDKKMDEKLEPVYNRLDTLEEKVETRLTVVENELGSVKDRLGSVEADIASVKERTKKIELLLENDTTPRLKTIESCYLDTYKRYCGYIDRFDTLQSDMDVVKTTLKRHSEMLKKLA